MSHHSWSLIDWATNDAETTPHFFMAFFAFFFFMAGAAGAAAFFIAFFIAFMAAMVPRVLKASCRIQSELLEPTAATHMSEATRAHRTTHLKDLKATERFECTQNVTNMF